MRRRRQQRQFSLVVALVCTIAMWACLAVVAHGQIVITPVKPALHDPIVASLNLGTQIPEGAKIRGSWECLTAKWLPCGEGIHIWAPAGKHLVRAMGVWVLTRDVTVGDQTFPILVDFGQYSYQAEVLVGSDPVPPPPPPPPPPSDKFQVVMFYQADKLDNYPQAQRSLLTSLALRQKLVAQGHQVLEILEEATLSITGGPYAEFIASVQGDALPRVALRPVSGGAVVDYALPADEAGLMKLLGGK